MKKTIIKLITLLVAALLLMVGCSYEADEPAASPTGTPAPTSTPVPTPEPEPALAICMNVIDHPIHRQVQLGFIDGCKELGYEDVSIIGTVEGDQKTQLDMALEWARSVEGRKAGMLLWNGDHGSDELCKKLGDMGIYVGIPHFEVLMNDYDEDIFDLSVDKNFDEVRLPEGVTFECRINDYEAGRYAAEYMAKRLDGKKGSVISIVSVKNAATNYHEWGFRERFEELKAEGKYDLSCVEMLEPRLNGGDDERGEQMFCDLMTEHPDIIGVFLIPGLSAKRWKAACIRTGRDMQDMVTVCYEVTEENIEFFTEGTADMLIGRRLYYEAYKCAQNFDRLFNGEYVPKFEYIDAEYLNEDTADELLPKYKELFERTKDDEFFEKHKARSFIGE